MADRYAPALFLEVVAFWFVLRWLLLGRLILLIGSALVVMMIIGALGTLDERQYVWSACFGGSAALAWLLLRRWRRTRHQRQRGPRLPRLLSWRGKTPDEVAVLCERRIGLPVDAATPIILAAKPPTACVLALAGDGLWVLEDESRLGRERLGRVLACWDRESLVAHVDHCRRSEVLELSWPRQGALIRGTMRSGRCVGQFASQLAADELASRRAPE